MQSVIVKISCNCHRHENMNYPSIPCCRLQWPIGSVLGAEAPPKTIDAETDISEKLFTVPDNNI